MRARHLVAVLPIMVALVPTTPAAAGAKSAVSWDLAKQYPTEAAWTSSFTDVQRRAAKFAGLKGRPITSAAQLAALLEEGGFLRGRAGNMARFALLNAAADTTDAKAKARFDATTGLEARVEADVSWLDGAASALGRERLLAWSKADPRLANHGWALHAALSTIGHNYSAGTEPAYAALERAATTPSNVYDRLMASDLGWPTIADAQGKRVSLDPGKFSDLSTDRDTARRRAAFDAFYKRLKALEPSLGELLTRKYEIERILARARNFRNSTDGFFAIADGILPGAYRRMIALTKAHRATIARYARLVGRLNGLPNVGYADLSVAAPEPGGTFTLDRAEALAIESLASLGPHYREVLRKRLASPWFDLVSRSNKDSGSLGVYWQVGNGGHPYGIVSYANNYGGSRTIAAMAGLTMFYADIPAAKAPVRRQEDFPIYGNAIWFMSALMQIDHLLQTTHAKPDRVALLAADVRRLWHVYVQGVIVTDFEARLEDAIASGKPPGAGDISKMYLSTLRDYYGDSISIPDAAGEEWMTLGNAYYGHVMDEWAFAMAGAVAMAERVKAGDRNTIAAIVSPMMKPDSYSSYDLLRDAGTDPTRPGIYEAVFRRMEADMDALERELKGAKPS
ncbi:MAG TPA: hypothetical protein VGG69_08825 [Rhizomicrobium sp.]